MADVAHTEAIGSTAGLSAWIQSNVLGLVILVIGIVVILLARKKDMGNALSIIAVVLLGLMVVGLAVNGNGVRVGTWLAGLVFG